MRRHLVVAYVKCDNVALGDLNAVNTFLNIREGAHMEIRLHGAGEHGVRVDTEGKPPEPDQQQDDECYDLERLEPADDLSNESPHEACVPYR